MKKQPLILACDIGTSGVKTSLFALDGRSAGSASYGYGTRFPLPNRAEQKPEDWWRGVCVTTRRLISRLPQARERVAGIGLSGHMLGCLPVDARGKPLRDTLIHSDSRAVRECARLREALGGKTIYRITGNVLDPKSSLCKMMWVRRHERTLYNRTARFLQAKDYVNFKLTGNLDTTDYSDASHAQTLDIRRRRYAAALCDAAGIDPAKLPALHAASDIIGHLSRAAARALNLPSGIPVVAGGGDGACATAGSGSVRAGDSYVCMGSTSWVASLHAAPFIDARIRVFNIVGLDPATCGVFGTVQSAGSSFDWVMRLLGVRDFKQAERMIRKCPPGSGGLIFLPYLMGERSPIWDPTAKGVFFGLTHAHARGELLRAVVEGVSFALRSIADILEEAHGVGTIRLIGGGARLAAWRHILCNVLNRKLVLPRTPLEDATSLGAAIAAGVGVGLFPSFRAAAAIIRPRSEMRPDRTHRQYAKPFEVYQSLYPRLKDAFAAHAKAAGI
ncbi:MAG: FGGY-family carbohydrate kinase [Kiritimatiellae bacterium]|nr:FGGY-family carbohydrate kinase [Kiritimatiellia bacterium]